MTGVTLTAAMRANLASLQGTAQLMGQTQLRLSTGLKVNSAIDNPSSFFAAQGLNQSANDLSSLLDSMAQNIQTIKAATNGIDGLTALMNQAKAVAQTALAQPGVGGSVTGTVSLTNALMGNLGGAIVGSITLTTSGTNTATIAVANGESVSTLMTAINTADDGAGTNFRATLVAAPTTGEFFLKIDTTNGSAFTVGGTAASYGAVGVAAGATGTAANITTQLAQYTTLLTQINKLASDSGYRGKNLLNGDSITTQFNALNTNTMTTAGVTTTATGVGGGGLGMTTAANFTVANLQTAINNVSAGVVILQNEASNFGNDLAIIQSRSDFSNAMVGTLKDGANQLTVADKNTEGANMLALQTSQQLGIQALSMASQANQSVLRLFQ